MGTLYNRFILHQTIHNEQARKDDENGNELVQVL